jgi:hypothetical protein
MLLYMQKGLVFFSLFLLMMPVSPALAIDGPVGTDQGTNVVVQANQVQSQGVSVHVQADQGERQPSDVQVPNSAPQQAGQAAMLQPTATPPPFPSSPPVASPTMLRAGQALPISLTPTPTAAPTPTPSAVPRAGQPASTPAAPADLFSVMGAFFTSVVSTLSHLL